MEQVREKSIKIKKNKQQNNGVCTQKLNKEVLSENKLIVEPRDRTGDYSVESQFQNDSIKAATIPDEKIIETEQCDEKELREVVDSNGIRVDSVIESTSSIPLCKTKEQLDCVEIVSSLYPGLECIKNEYTDIVETSNELIVKPYTESQLAALYINTELTHVEAFTTAFIEAELRGIDSKEQYLYKLLRRYMEIREASIGNDLELRQVRDEYANLQEHLWSLEDASISGRSECKDGNIVMAQHAFLRAIFHRPVYQSLGRLLAKVQNLLFNNHILYAYSAENVRLQIELYIQLIIEKFLTACTGQNISLNGEIADAHRPLLVSLRHCISILFHFQRKQIRDRAFFIETRNWLRRLVSLLLKFSNYQDHLFVLNHILRCPAGIHQWASDFVYVPLNDTNKTPFKSYEINHILAVLSVILSPIRERDIFLEEIVQSKDSDVEQAWIIVDSDGEEDDESGNSLRENDLVALLGQLPLEQMFCKLLLVNQKDAKKDIDISKLTQTHILQFFAFSTTFLNVLHNGLETYAQSRYAQFYKRLSRLVRHFVQYATDLLEIFQNQKHDHDDQAMAQRLQVEYDSFFMRVIKCLYGGQKLGAWQFLAVVPFDRVSTGMLWKVYRFLRDDDDNQSLFDDKLLTLADDELIYLLNTFANMALARNANEMVFIERIINDLFKVGFLDVNVHESRSKCVRTLLTHITSQHPTLLSQILCLICKDVQKIDAHCFFLYEDLPLSIWSVTSKDFGHLSTLVMMAPEEHAYANKLGRMIISRLNYNMLPYDMHCSIALLVLRSSDQPEYDQWAWQTVYRLKLHINDKLFNDLSAIRPPDHYDILQRRLHEPLNAFVAILMTSWGHLIPLIMSHGFELVHVLQQHHKHEAVLFCLNLLVPLFVDCQEYLVNCEQYQKVLTQLTQVDQSYISLVTRAMLTSDEPSIIDQFSYMLENQIINFHWYHLDSPRCLVRLWLNSFLSITNWNSDPVVLSLLDTITCAAFFHADAIDVVRASFADLLHAGSATESTGAFGLLKWVTSSTQHGQLLVQASLKNYTWLAFIVLDVEFYERELKTNIWKEVLVQLFLQKGKSNVDQAIKKATANVKLPSFSSTYLCIYRWAQQALDTPIEHVLLPLFWQRFFQLYLARLPSGYDKCCVGSQFFEGIVNFGFLKRIKKRLQETVDFFEKQREDFSEIEESSSLTEVEEKRRNYEFIEKSLSIFRAFSLWLEEPRLQDKNLMLPSLPQQYLPSLLSYTIQGVNTLWLEYVDQEHVKVEQSERIKIWQTSNFRNGNKYNRPLTGSGKSVENLDPIKRILHRLTDYETPKPPPSIQRPPPIVMDVSFENSRLMLQRLQPCFAILNQFSHCHMSKLAQHTALNTSYDESIEELYRFVPTKVTKQVNCSLANCAGPATIVLEMTQAKLNERVDRQIQTNRQMYEQSISEQLQSPAQVLCHAALTIQHAVENLTDARMGVTLFYHIFNLLNDETHHYRPTRALFAECLDKLGQRFIKGVESEMAALLQTILSAPHFSEYLIPHFCPKNVKTDSLLHMYELISSVSLKLDEVAYKLLSKFDIAYWLSNEHPKLIERSQFINAVMKSLVTFGLEPPLKYEQLHILYRQHLLIIFRHQFPEHFGEVLVQLLRNTCSNTISTQVWLDVLDALVVPFTSLHTSKTIPISPQTARQFGYGQNILQHQELIETCELLSTHFTKERLQFGIYGLYPKCRPYIYIIANLLCLISHSLVVSTHKTYEGELRDKPTEKMWPLLSALYAPWLIPYSMNNNVPLANWIQQLTDDRSILLPWIQTDDSNAEIIISTFFECVHFITEVIPASSIVYSLTWQWYVTNFAHESIQEYILTPIQDYFSKLSWNTFWPTFVDVELMLRVIDQYLPKSHVFLRHIFVQVQWPSWMQTAADAPFATKCRIHQCFINLLVKISNDSSIVDATIQRRLRYLLDESKQLDITCIDTNALQQLMDWWLMSCDPGVILKKPESADLDAVTLQLLRCYSYYDQIQQTSSSTDYLQKRKAFVRTFVKLIDLYTTRHKSELKSKELELKSVIGQQLCHLENLIGGNAQSNELRELLREMLRVMNVIELARPTLYNCLQHFIANKSGDSVTILALLETLNVVEDVDMLGSLLEQTITVYFENNIHQNSNPTWSVVSNAFGGGSLQHRDLETVLVTNGHMLALYAIILKRKSVIENRFDGAADLLNTVIDWIGNVKINNESSEAKSFLLWWFVLNVAYENCPNNEQVIGVLLYKFAKILIQISEKDRSNNKWGRSLLSAIGFSKQETISSNFRFVCRALSGYILAQLPDMKGDPQTVRYKAHAAAKIGQPGGNTECSKILLTLDMDRTQGKIKECEQMVLRQIQDGANSLHNIDAFLRLLCNQFYIRTFLKEIGR